MNVTAARLEQALPGRYRTYAPEELDAFGVGTILAAIWSYQFDDPNPEPEIHVRRSDGWSEPIYESDWDARQSHLSPEPLYCVIYNPNPTRSQEDVS